MSGALTACHLVFPEACEEPIRSVFDAGEHNSSQVGDVGPYVAFERDLPHALPDHIRSRRKESAPRCRTCFKLQQQPDQTHDRALLV